MALTAVAIHKAKGRAKSYKLTDGDGVNGLNQYTSAGAIAFGYDGRGNLTSSGGSTFTYTTDNQLATAPGVGLAYDPLGWLFNGVIDSGVNTTLIYDGGSVTTEIDQNNTSGLLSRYVYGPGSDEPLIWYEGAGTAASNRRFLSADERGSIVAVTDSVGNAVALNRYDEFGIPQSGNIGRFQYTGQKWLPTVGMYDYKARIYSPTMGRFMQTDPIGYADGINWYNYVGSDPVNRRDPTGLSDSMATYCAQFTRKAISDMSGASTPYTGQPIPQRCYDYWNSSNPGYGSHGTPPVDEEEVVVTGWRRTGPGFKPGPDLSGIFSPLPSSAVGQTSAGQARSATGARPQKSPAKKPIVTCEVMVDVIASIVLINGAKTGLGAIPEGIEAAEFLRIVSAVSKLKALAIGTGVAAVGLVGGSIIYYYMKPQILKAICGN